VDIEFSKEELAFRDEVRQWLADNVPPAIREKTRYNVPLTKDEQQGWERILGRKGWLVSHWPQEYGGPGWTATQRYLFDVERAFAGAPLPSPFGVSMVGPVIMTFGTPEQKQRYLPKIASGEEFWCQGYSEPDAGSDLASLKTAAQRDGNEYVINGSKIWTTQAHWADRMFCLVRTSQEAKKQRGITFLLLDMKSPGITVRPIITIDGHHHLNQVFFDNVRVPVENRVGEEGDGWTVAKHLLQFERTTIAGVADSKKAINNLKRLAREDRDGGVALCEFPDIQRRLAELEVDLLALEYSNFRTLDAVARGEPPGPESSLLKIKGTELQQALSQMRLEMGAGRAMPWLTDQTLAPPAYQHATTPYFFLRAATIYGGSNEIQKNVIAKMLLGLG
jgi:alkylation response protein AidB-like acyl-CoA dehydrogenase